MTVSIGMHAQDIAIQPEESSTFFQRAWQMQFAMVNGQKMGQGAQSTKTTFGFRTDGTFIVRGADGSDSTGTWTYFYDKKYIDLMAQNRIVARIKSFTPDLVIMTVVTPSGEVDPKGTVEIHFKPL